ncbi:hypothetical protein BJAS_P3456 [Bathymodiolus japonicus methanotrophic gill symbiont]|uniref:hypothetical protein n=1 Tax=Bathymodiolus japonicus methanotrophic gill symbiont TaxID=113269 RepID=UPI001B6AD098|nr:hypothetical protein [Bathymodiolus japonicus methanotrophic gill symbiont]GFO72919.1 hypothetical protein BJAS_P3456 [Bathymodiolus japonicus methanotrophic gill symbiont]
MSVTRTNCVSGPYIGNGTQTSFQFGFKAWKKEDIIVYYRFNSGPHSGRQVIINQSDYEVVFNASGIGGTVNERTTLAPSIGDELQIEGNFARNQLSVFNNQEALYPKTIERALDRLTLIAQYLNRKVIKCIHLHTMTDDTINLQLPPPEAGKVIGWSADGKSLKNYDR